MTTSNLFVWSAAVGAFPRIEECHALLQKMESYFDRLRFVNEALGPHWVFRLADAVGIDEIRKNRPSWAEFYVDDVDGLHCPLDPGAPEISRFLGREYSDLDLAFYAGMGFEGYRLALKTQRLVDITSKSIKFAGQYHLESSEEFVEELNGFLARRHVPKEEYYARYGAALSVLYESITSCNKNIQSDNQLERTAAGCLLFLCGGHKGCSTHPTPAERFHAQMEGLIIFQHTHDLVTGISSLQEMSSSPVLVSNNV